jgi:hypothetical protein
MRDVLGWKWIGDRIVFHLSVLCVILLAAGCSSTLQAKKSPGADLSQLKAFYVQKLPADGRGIERVIADRLTQMGYRASSGPGDSPSSPVDAIVTYQDKWMWDITMYMIELSVQLREPQTRTVLATGHSMRTSLVRKDPEGMVEEVLTEIFKRGHP